MRDVGKIMVNIGWEKGCFEKLEEEFLKEFLKNKNYLKRKMCLVWFKYYIYYIRYFSVFFKI